MQRILIRLLCLVAVLPLPWAGHAQRLLPHNYNVPYLLKGPDGQCGRIAFEVNGVEDYDMIFSVPCDPTDPRQAFYILNEAKDGEYPPNDGDLGLPADPTAKARIVSAISLDLLREHSVPGHDHGDFLYQVMTYNDSSDPKRNYLVGVARFNPPNIDTPHLFFTFERLPLENFTKVADQDQAFQVAGRRLIRYGLPPPSPLNLTITLDGMMLPNLTAFCSTAFFGRDPAPGQIKQCSMPGEGAPTPFTVVLKNYAGACIVPGIVMYSDLKIYRSDLTCSLPSVWQLIPLSQYPKFPPQ